MQVSKLWSVAVGACLLCPAWALAQGTAEPGLGISVLASSVGTEYPVDALVEFVTTAHISYVIIDWAWVTYHWDRTDFDAVRQFIWLLDAAGIRTAAMYRPRFLQDPTVPCQVKADGSPAADHGFEICYSSPEARAWGASWGERILAECPTFGEVIIYNPGDLCACPACAAARRPPTGGRYAPAWVFLAEARARWRTRCPDVKLGVVHDADPEFWSRGTETLDVAHPYLYLLEGADAPGVVAAAQAVGVTYGDRMGACLAKVTWGPTDKVTPEKVADLDRLARQHGLSYCLWLFDTLFLSDLYDPEAVCQALGLDYAALRPPLERMRTAAAAAAAR